MRKILKGIRLNIELLYKFLLYLLFMPYVGSMLMVHMDKDHAQRCLSQQDYKTILGL